MSYLQQIQNANFPSTIEGTTVDFGIFTSTTTTLLGC